MKGRVKTLQQRLEHDLRYYKNSCDGDFSKLDKLSKVRVKKLAEQYHELTGRKVLFRTPPVPEAESNESFDKTVERLT
ncbi:hypothetical protein JCM19232_1059 [Vibrio ishigakensis]|uniref:Uncharacterized protein n=1 Tax=Vibrio ishigakensis TaxID=1481914 RepID=A0A0B8PNX5_9VIBR|nr:hypothetical protein JCM19232_1059 [Vibrio ishigakensis]